MYEVGYEEDHLLQLLPLAICAYARTVRLESGRGYIFKRGNISWLNAIIMDVYAR